MHTASYRSRRNALGDMIQSNQAPRLTIPQGIASGHADLLANGHEPALHPLASLFEAAPL